MDRYTFFKGRLDFLRQSRHLIPLLKADHFNVLCTQAPGSAGYIHGHITAADYNDSILNLWRILL